MTSFLQALLSLFCNLSMHHCHHRTMTPTTKSHIATPSTPPRCEHGVQTVPSSHIAIMSSFMCTNLVSQLVATISIRLQMRFTMTALSPPSSLEITTASNTTIPTQISPTTKPLGFHSFSALSKKVITHLRNSGI